MILYLLFNLNCANGDKDSTLPLFSKQKTLSWIGLQTFICLYCFKRCTDFTTGSHTLHEFDLTLAFLPSLRLNPLRVYVQRLVLCMCNPECESWRSHHDFHGEICCSCTQFCSWIRTSVCVCALCKQRYRHAKDVESLTLHMYSCVPPCVLAAMQLYESQVEAG